MILSKVAVWEFIGDMSGRLEANFLLSLEKSGNLTNGWAKFLKIDLLHNLKLFESSLVICQLDFKQIF